MGLSDRLRPGGKGVLATVGADGSVNTAVYAPPQLTDSRTAAWGMAERRTYRNVLENPNASYLYIEPGAVIQGVRLTLRLREIRDSGKVLDAIRARTREAAGEVAANALRYVAFFDILEERPLL